MLKFHKTPYKHKTALWRFTLYNDTIRACFHVEGNVHARSDQLYK